MSQRQKNGFTLIELLVVMTIIVLLIAILLPTISKAIFNSRIAVCASQMHQWSLASLNYASDNSAALPRFDIGSGAASGTSWDMGISFWPKCPTPGNWHVKDFSPPISDYYPYCPEADPALLYSYGINSAELYFCPLDDGSLWPSRDKHGNRMMRYHGGGSWMYWSYVYWAGRSGRNTSGIRPKVDINADGTMDEPPLRYSDRRSDVPLMSDRVDNGISWTFPQAELKPPNNAFHVFNGNIQNANVAYVDGSVKTKQPAEMKDRLQDRWGPVHTWY